MRIFGTALGTALVVVLLAALLAGSYFGFKYIADVFAVLGKQTGTIAAIASVVAILCAVILAEAMKARGLSERQAAASREKTALYEALLASCAARWSAQGDGLPPSNGDVGKLERLLALHGGNKVISAYVRLGRLPRDGESPGDDASALLRTLAVEMRSDLGCLSAGRSGTDLLPLLLGRG